MCVEFWRIFRKSCELNLGAKPWKIFLQRSETQHSSIFLFQNHADFANLLVNCLLCNRMFISNFILMSPCCVCIWKTRKKTYLNDYILRHLTSDFCTLYWLRNFFPGKLFGGLRIHCSNYNGFHYSSNRECPGPLP